MKSSRPNRDDPKDRLLTHGEKGSKGEKQQLGLFIDEKTHNNGGKNEEKLNARKIVAGERKRLFRGWGDAKAKKKRRAGKAHRE